MSEHHPLPQQCLDWSDYIEKRNCDPDAFRRHLRMSYGLLEKLLSYICADLKVDHMATLHGGAIMPEVCSFCTLHWLAGGTYLDIYDIARISKMFGEPENANGNPIDEEGKYITVP